MSMKYQDMLQTLELLPAWQLRQSTSAPVMQDAQPSAAEAVNPINSMSLQDIQQYFIGAGDPHADWLFVGEPAGELEKQLGQPFAGSAGDLLDKMLIAINLKRNENVYLLHMEHAFPDSLAMLLRLIQLIQPKFIVCLGEQVSQTLSGSHQTLDSLRGKLHYLQATPLVASYAPQHLLQYQADKRKAWEDLCLARDSMANLSAAR